MANCSIVAWYIMYTLLYWREFYKTVLYTMCEAIQSCTILFCIIRHFNKVQYGMIFDKNLVVNAYTQLFCYKVIITTILNKRLRQNRNAFIVSLAVADFLVASVTMPASITGNLYHYIIIFCVH